LLCIQVFGQDDTTTQPTTTSAITKVTTTAAAETTSKAPVISCVVCEANSTIGENMDCFDGVGETKEFGENGVCAYHYTVDQVNGETTYKIKREGSDKAGDKSEYPRSKVSENWSQICTDTSCNDKDAKDWFGVKALVARMRRSASIQFVLGDEETTTSTKTETTTTTTTTAPPDFSCYICNADSANENYTDLAGCGSLDESAAVEVCGAEDIGSCITQFNKEEDEVEGVDNWSVMRGCNSKDNPQEVAEESHKMTSFWCIDSMCNHEKFSGSFNKLSANIILLVLFLQ